MENITSAYALGTFSIAGGVPFAGLVVDDRVVAVRALNAAPFVDGIIDNPITGADTVRGIIEDWERNVVQLRRAAQAFKSREMAARVQAVSVPIEALRLHAPVEPRQIVCAGGNYRTHVIQITTAHGKMTVAEAEKMIDKIAADGEPYAWSKLVSTLAGPYDPIALPRTSEKPDWELELAVIIGRAARHVHRDDALNYVAGYTIANDLTARDLVFRSDLKEVGTDWFRGKCSPGFLPLGPLLVPSEFVAQPNALHITLKHNGRTMQDETTADMIHKVPRLIEYISGHVQLYPGDVICTGSPAGNGMHYGVFLQPGDVLEGSITGLGVLRNSFVAA